MCIRDRLENEVGHECALYVFVRIDGRLELSLKAHFHDVQVPPQQLELALEHDLLALCFLQRVAEQLAESRDHLANAPRVALDERRDRIAVSYTHLRAH